MWDVVLYAVWTQCSIAECSACGTERKRPWIQGRSWILNDTENTVWLRLNTALLWPRSYLMLFTLVRMGWGWVWWGKSTPLRFIVKTRFIIPGSCWESGETGHFLGIFMTSFPLQSVSLPCWHDTSQLTGGGHDAGQCHKTKQTEAEHFPCHLKPCKIYSVVSHTFCNITA